MGSKGENVKSDIPRQDAFEPKYDANPPGTADPVVCNLPPQASSWRFLGLCQLRSSPHQCLLVPTHNSQAEMEFSQLAWLGLNGLDT